MPDFALYRLLRKLAREDTGFPQTAHLLTLQAEQVALRIGAQSFDRYYGICLADQARAIRREYEDTHPECLEDAA